MLPRWAEWEFWWHKGRSWTDFGQFLCFDVDPLWPNRLWPILVFWCFVQILRTPKLCRPKAQNPERGSNPVANPSCLHVSGGVGVVVVVVVVVVIDLDSPGPPCARPPSAGPPPPSGPPKISLFFPPLPPPCSFFLSFSGGLLVEFWGVHTTAREFQTCTSEGPGASSKTNISREDPQRKREITNMGAGEGKKAKF